MMPPLFTQQAIDGWSAMWVWFHVDSCRKGSWISMPVDRQPWPDFIEWIDMPVAQPPAQKELFT